jgi:methylated-DNA-[protein]-cysteine S-methyltransferase
MEILHYTTMDSFAGRLLLAASSRGLAKLEFMDGRVQLGDRWFPEAKREESAEKLQHYVQELQQYFAGRRRDFSFPLDLRGTGFQVRCWNALLEIPYGEVRTYAQQAKAVGCPRGFRAVGMANHDNPVAIVVPCHRVIASDGTLGGYGGGLDLKRKLLELEGARWDAKVGGIPQQLAFGQGA